MSYATLIRERFQASIDIRKTIAADQELVGLIERVSEEVIRACKDNKQILFCGNGGSAADAQHLASEFTGKFYKNRRPLNAEALHLNTSYLTAVANDYSYDEVFSRLVEAKGNKGDVLVSLSTSGNSPNILRAIAMANKTGMINIGLTGKTGGKMIDQCDYLIRVPSEDIPRIQETHILIGHIICEITEKSLFPDSL